MACQDCDNNCTECTCKSNTVIYGGADLDCLGIKTGDNLESVLSKIDAFICNISGGSGEVCSDSVLYCGTDISCGILPIATNGDTLDTIVTNINNLICSLDQNAVAITVQDEGIDLTNLLTSLNFVGDGVDATTVGGDVTVTINNTPTPFTYTQFSNITYSPSFDGVFTGYATYGELFLHKRIRLINNTGADINFGTSYADKYVCNVPAPDIAGLVTIGSMGFLSSAIGTVLNVEIKADGKVYVNTLVDTVLPAGESLHIMIPTYKYADPLTILPAPPAV